MRTLEEKAILREIWYHMITHGRVMDRDTEWDFHGGQFADYFNHKLFKQNKRATETLICYTRVIGVDWDHTDVPTYTQRATFTDSFNDPKEVDVWTGQIVLKDGTEWFVGAINIDLSKLVDDLKTEANKGCVQASIEKMFGPEL